MRIGIIGAGAIGQAFARQALRAGYQVILSNSRGPQSLASLVEDLGPGASAGTVREAALADMVMIAVPWKYLPQALADVPPWEGRIVVDMTNPLVPPDFRAANLHGRTSSEVVADLVPGARLVKAFNTLPPELLSTVPYEAGGRHVIFLSGNDAAARAEVSRLIQSLGFASIDLGDLPTGGRLQGIPGGPLPALNLIKLA